MSSKNRINDFFQGITKIEGFFFERRNIGIKRKLFMVTTVVFALFITTNLILNSLFFEKFYVKKVKSELEDVSNKFKKNYEALNDLDDFNKIIKEYEDENPVKIIILDSNDKLKMFSKAQPSRVDSLKSKELTQFIYQWESNDINRTSLEKHKSETVISSDPRGSNEKKLINISKVGNGQEIVFIMRSLQHVNDASSTMKEFYLYSYIVAFVFILALSLAFSKMISKPLLTISDTATNMAKLDFKSKCEINTGDEFENVAESLNFLSENLNVALNSLKEANIKLEEDIDKERRLEAMRKEFIAAVSHELKTPITLIDGYAVGLKDEIFEGEDRDFYLDIIIDESRKMSRLVTDMLELSHLESENLKLDKQNFNLGELINRTSKKYTSMINEKKVNLEISTIDKWIFADFNKMEQVLTNFITNAIKHVNQEGTLKILMREQEDELVVEIENTGKNIPKDELGPIWEKFYKIDKSRSRKVGGTGLGLSITKNILQRHNFKYGVENTSNGVRFYFIVDKAYSEK